MAGSCTARANMVQNDSLSRRAAGLAVTTSRARLALRKRRAHLQSRPTRGRGLGTDSCHSPPSIRSTLSSPGTSVGAPSQLNLLLLLLPIHLSTRSLVVVGHESGLALPGSEETIAASQSFGRRKHPTALVPPQGLYSNIIALLQAETRDVDPSLSRVRQERCKIKK